MEKYGRANSRISILLLLLYMVSTIKSPKIQPLLHLYSLPPVTTLVIDSTTIASRPPFLAYLTTPTLSFHHHSFPTLPS